jgi:hypothetical protein
VFDQDVVIEEGIGEQLIELQMPTNICTLDIHPVGKDGLELDLFYLSKLYRVGDEYMIIQGTQPVADGKAFRLENWPAGNYKLSVEAPRHGKVDVDVLVEPGETKILRPILPLRP